MVIVGRTTLGDGNGRVAAEIVAIVHDVLAFLTPGGEAPAPPCDYRQVALAPGADGRAATVEALCATADALLDLGADDVAEAVYDLAYDMDQVVAALGPAWSAAPPSQRPLLVLRELVRRSIDPRRAGDRLITGRRASRLVQVDQPRTRPRGAIVGVDRVAGTLPPRDDHRRRDRDSCHRGGDGAARPRLPDAAGRAVLRGLRDRRAIQRRPPRRR